MHEIEDQRSWVARNEVNREIKIEVANTKNFLNLLENFMKENNINQNENKTIESFKATIAKEYSTEEIINMRNSKKFLDKACVKKIDMYYSGWEWDTEAWILEDARMFTTNHGQICEFTKEKFDLYKKEMIDYSESLKEI